MRKVMRKVIVSVCVLLLLSGCTLENTVTGEIKDVAEAQAYEMLGWDSEWVVVVEDSAPTMSVAHVDSRPHMSVQVEVEWDASDVGSHYELSIRAGDSVDIFYIPHNSIQPALLGMSWEQGGVFDYYPEELPYLAWVTEEGFVQVRLHEYRLRKPEEPLELRVRTIGFGWVSEWSETLVLRQFTVDKLTVKNRAVQAVDKINVEWVTQAWYELMSTFRINDTICGDAGGCMDTEWRNGETQYHVVLSIWAAKNLLWGNIHTLIHELAHVYSYGGTGGALFDAQSHFDLTYKYERDADGLFIYDTLANPEGTAGAGREPVWRKYEPDWNGDCGEEMFASALEHATSVVSGLEPRGSYYGTGCAPDIEEPTPEDIEAIRPLMGVKAAPSA